MGRIIFGMETIYLKSEDVIELIMAVFIVNILKKFIANTRVSAGKYKRSVQNDN